MTTQITNVAIDAIDPNPFRRLGEYPYLERKLESLQRSFDDVGMWPGVIARKAGNRFQLAFGHHRVEAARRAGIDAVPLIVQNLSDERMLQYMGRENLEDYNADFLRMLESWEAAINFVDLGQQKREPIDIAKLLGWTTPLVRRGSKKSEVCMNATARACAAAHELIQGGYVSRNDLSDICVSAARNILERATSLMQQVDMMAKSTKRPAKEIYDTKQHIGSGARRAAKEYRKHKDDIPTNDLRGKVDQHTFGSAKEAKQQIPLFAVFAASLVNSIDRMLRDDIVAEKLEELTSSLDNLLEEDHAEVRKIKLSLEEHERRTAAWRKRLDHKKVVNLNVVTKGN